MAFVGEVSGDLARGIRRCLLLSELANRDAPTGPGMLMIAPGGFETEVATAAARTWLGEIEDMFIGSGLPLAVGGLVARARQRPDTPARMRLRTRSGQWLTSYAESVESTPNGRVCVVLEPARPHELAAIIADAYAFTQRERDVARLVITGHSNQEIARLLFLSPWTVQDHLKKVFEKAGVHSRSELTARMFFGHYLPRTHEDAAVGADGWFTNDSPGALSCGHNEDAGR
jgi:DNA-binding CsgD family transcriptional regulator